MIRLTATFVSLAVLLAACGADAPPSPPDDAPGLSISGQVRVGIVGGSG